MSYLLIALAALCKESALTLLAVLPAYDLLVLRRPWRSLWRTHWPVLVVVSAWMMMAHDWLSRSVTGAVRPLRDQLLIQAKALPWYLHKIVMPVGLNVEPQFSPVSDPLLAAGGLLLVGSALCLTWPLLSGRGKFLVMAGGCWLLPTTLMPLNILVNERRLYMPLALACVGVGLVLFKERKT